MQVSKCGISKTCFLASQTQSSEANAAEKKKDGFLDKFETHIRNTSDMNDVIKVPRTIFKGYMAFMVSTTMVAIASFAKDKSKLLPKATNIAAGLIALWGSYSFVKPYLVRDLSNQKREV